MNFNSDVLFNLAGGGKIKYRCLIWLSLVAGI